MSCTRSVPKWGNRNSSNGVEVDLSKGTAQDGLGGVDTLINIEEVRGSEHDDVLIGSDGNNFFRGFFTRRQCVLLGRLGFGDRRRVR